jgi:CheY-like chemotaxis protein
VSNPPSKSTILVVDDERDSRDMTGELLAHAGYQVMYASHGMEALSIVDRYSIDFIVMDMMMPVMDGITAIRRLKSDIDTARIPVLAVTGDHGAALREEATAAGCDTYVIKPIEPVSFISLVRHWVKP